MTIPKLKAQIARAGVFLGRLLGFCDRGDRASIGGCTSTAQGAWENFSENPMIPLVCPLTPIGSPLIGNSALETGPLFDWESNLVSSLLMKTFSAKAEEVDRKWWVIDAKDKILGQVAVEAARLLRGKHKPIYTSHVDTGDFVVVINAGQAKLSGTKETKKQYVRYTGWVGGQKSENASTLRARHPERLVEYAVKGMIPRNRLGRQVLKKLKVYAGDSHPHEAQSPQEYAIK